MLIVHCASGVEELHLLNRKTFYKTSVADPQQLYVQTVVVHFPFVKSLLFVPIPLSVASPIEFQQTLISCYKTVIDYIASM